LDTRCTGNFALPARRDDRVAVIDPPPSDAAIR
jgi:hypothetical protein